MAVINGTESRRAQTRGKFSSPAWGPVSQEISQQTCRHCENFGLYLCFTLDRLTRFLTQFLLCFGYCFKLRSTSFVELLNLLDERDVWLLWRHHFLCDERFGVSQMYGYCDVIFFCVMNVLESVRCMVIVTSSLFVWWTFWDQSKSTLTCWLFCFTPFTVFVNNVGKTGWRLCSV